MTTEPEIAIEPTPPANAAVVVRGVRKSYGSFEALRGVDLEVRRGEVFALLGPNGAGKTTLVEILEGYRSRSAGDALVLGVDPESADRAWRDRVGIVLQSTTIFDLLTVEEVVRHFASFYPAPLDPGRVIELVGLEAKRRTRCGNLSGGQKRRVDLALGLIGDPDLIFLDEPTTGLDPEGRRQLWDVVRDLAALGKTVLLTTHYLEEADALANRVAVLAAGEIVALGSPAELGSRDRQLATVRFELAGPLAGAQLPAVGCDVACAEGWATIRTESPTAVLTALIDWAQALGVPELPGLSVTRPSLEDVYLQMVGTAGHEEE
ncbi:MAG: ABC transporter ATP-binding protein [Hyphomicrobiales bacterium]